MAKISNKKYDEFWDKDDFNIKNTEDNKTEIIDDVIKKQVDIKEKKDIVKPKKKVKKIIEKPKVVETNNVKEKTEPKILVNQTTKEIYQMFIDNNEPYKIYYRGNIIFDSNKNNNIPILDDTFFMLFNTKYFYRGIRFEKY